MFLLCSVGLWIVVVKMRNQVEQLMWIGMHSGLSQVMLRVVPNMNGDEGGMAIWGSIRHCGVLAGVGAGLLN